MNSHVELLSFRVGGVQEFIDSARTTEDFWASSFLISFLTRTAAAAVLSPSDLIFPAASTLAAGGSVENPLSSGRGSLPTERGSLTERGALPGGGPEASDNRIAYFPNGLLAIVEEGQAENACMRIEQVFHDTWRQEMENVRSQLLSQVLTARHAHEIWERQAGRRTFETFWAWTPWRTDTEKYVNAYRRLSGAVESRKLLRDFDPATEPGVKCSQCGRLQALTDGTDAKAFWKKLSEAADDLTTRFRASERLCSVCIACRLWSRTGGQDQLKKSQPSTSSIAATPFVHALFARGGEIDAQVREFTSAVKAIDPKSRLRESPYSSLPAGAADEPDHWRMLRRLDGDWFYGQTYRPDYLKKERQIERVPEAALERGSRALSGLKEAAGVEPSGYVVLGAIDGDQVGDWINGSMRPDHEASVEAHRHLSGALARIGPAARQAIEGGMRGRLIYSGGDDLLFLVPAANLAGGLGECVRAIKEAMGPEYGRFTFSGSAIVLPHNDSLSGAIREVEEQLRSESKTKYGRDCLAISARRQSGQRTEAAFRWRRSASFQGLVGAMAAKEGGISPVLATQFAEIAPGLEEVDHLRLEEISLYLLKRHSSAPGKKEESAEWLAHQKLMLDVVESPGDLMQRPPGPLIETALFTARFLARSEPVVKTA